jgi:hypothetical protein
MSNRREFMLGASVLMAHAAFPQLVAAFAAAAPVQADARRLQFFSQPELRTVTILVDLILPATDSPAASAAATQYFVDLAAAVCATPAAQATLRAGLRDLAAQHFETLTAEQQGALLSTRAQADMALPYDRSFFKILKDYTLTGYFHSEIGATKALAYERVPGGYQGDLPLAPNQKAWAI